MHVGILGGTFDPIHMGHLIVAEEAKIQLNLAEIIFVPAGQPWLKANLSITPATHRIQMIRRAITDKHYFKLSTMEIERSGFSYTVDTITELKGQLDNEDELFFILGWDAIAQLPLWKEPSRLIEMCHLVAIPRVGYPSPNLQFIESKISGLSQRVIFMNKPKVDISAFAIRKRVTQGLSIHQLVPEAVEGYIKQHKLYITP